jgi:hypothetical protein
MNRGCGLDSELPVVVSFVREADMGLLRDIEEMYGIKIEQMPSNVAELFSYTNFTREH